MKTQAEIAYDQARATAWAAREKWEAAWAARAEAALAVDAAEAAAALAAAAAWAAAEAWAKVIAADRAFLKAHEDLEAERAKGKL